MLVPPPKRAVGATYKQVQADCILSTYGGRRHDGRLADHVYADHVDVAADIAVIDVVCGAVVVGSRSRLLIAKLHRVALRGVGTMCLKKDSDEQSNNDKRNIFEASHTRLTNISSPSERMGKKHHEGFSLNPKTDDA